MGSWDRQHRIRLRAERALDALRDIWGDDMPPGPNPELTALIDAVASDDAHGHQDRLICQDDGLSEETVARLWLESRHATAGPHTQDHRHDALYPNTLSTTNPAPVPLELLRRLREHGLLDDDLSADLVREQPSGDDLPGDPLGGPTPLGGTTATSPASSIQGAAARSTSTTGPHHPELDPQSPLTGVWELDPTTGTVAFDAVGAQLIGAGSEAGNAAVQDHLQQLIHPDDRDEIAIRMQQSLDTGQPYVMRFRIRSPGGGITWLLSQGRVLQNPADSSARLTGFITLDQNPHPSRDTEPITDASH